MQVRRSRSYLVMIMGTALAACSDGTGPDPSVDCSGATVRTLAVAQHQIVDPLAEGACVRLPAAGAGGAEHLYIPLATAGQETEDGVSVPYLISGVAAAIAAPPALPSPMLSAFRRASMADGFHAMLRSRERALSASPAQALFSEGRLKSRTAMPPVVGEQRTFDVCSSASCDEFVQATATARSVGNRVAIFVDNNAPPGGYSTPDLDRVRNLFDQYLYPIDTVAFGRESDIDGNSVVSVLLTPRVNALSPDCNDTGRIILGYFFGADLLPRSGANPGSNEAEVFFGLVPDPGNPDCTITTDEANSRLPATFIHEFQHMISFSQHVLVRGGVSEDTWLNEGLSHFAEELGGRLIPNPQCPSSTSCASEFLGLGDLANAFEYMARPDSFFLIEPGSSTGSLEERGANWLFVRWLADHFASDSILGTSLTRALVATNQVGSTNVESRTGVDFSTLVAEWQMTNYLDDLPGFTATGSRLRYKSWNFRFAAESLGTFFPLVPDSTDGTDYGHSGTLRAGSGRHVRVVQPAGGPGVDLLLTNATGGALPSSVEPRIALVRIR
ncbi:MAG TPA: hypothetical protein VFH26_06505 [Gemmatimonadales bacterium]|nr:hypothetical protein [Gemmatimonadales bacterium]